jgi:protein-S-isoprenylcysteine O-methyltransferase Ste14
MRAHLLAVIVGLILYSVLHSLLAAPRIQQRLHGLVRPAAFRLFYNVLATLLLFVLWIATGTDYPLLWDLHGWPAILLRILQAAALLLFLAALWPIDLLHFLGLRQLRGHIQEYGGLVTSGVYALCRHPLYLSICVFFSASPRMDLRWLVIVIWMWAYSFIGSIFEERRLAAQFGAAYLDYRRKCPRLLPFRLSRGGDT